MMYVGGYEFNSVSETPLSLINSDKRSPTVSKCMYETVVSTRTA
jgi:hypothetical protein